MNLELKIKMNDVYYFIIVIQLFYWFEEKLHLFPMLTKFSILALLLYFVCTTLTTLRFSSFETIRLRLFSSLSFFLIEHSQLVGSAFWVFDYYLCQYLATKNYQ